MVKRRLFSQTRLSHSKCKPNLKKKPINYCSTLVNTVLVGIRLSIIIIIVEPGFIIRNQILRSIHIIFRNEYKRKKCNLLPTH